MPETALPGNRAAPSDRIRPAVVAAAAAAAIGQSRGAAKIITPDAASDATPQTGLTLDADTSWLPVRTASLRERSALPAALILAAAAHAGLLYALLSAPADERVGRGGQDREIAVTIIRASQLELRRDGTAPMTPGDAAATTRAQSEARKVTAGATTQPSAPQQVLRPPFETTDAAPAGIVVSVMPRPVEADRAQADPADAAPSEGSAASEARDEGTNDAGGAATVTKPAGRIATGFDAIVVAALPQLQSHLRNRQTSDDVSSTGSLEIELTISGNGQPQNVRVIRSSGAASLDRQAVRDVQSFQFPAPPPRLPERERTYRLPIAYR
ncbi:MAG: TonB family protein [Pseudomonadota bacterium]